MPIELRSFEQQHRLETIRYLLRSVKWASLLSLFLVVMICLNIYIQPTPIVALTNLIRIVLPTAVLSLFGVTFCTWGEQNQVSKTLFLYYALLLTVSWLFLLLSLFHQSSPFRIEHEYATLAGVEMLIDILVVAFAIALFPNRKWVLVCVLPLILMGFIFRIQEAPESPVFAVTKLICFFVIVVSSQKVLSQWFDKAILRDVEKQQLVKQFGRMALIDGLTNLSNRRHFDQVLAQEIEASERHCHPLSIILLDVDFFKRFNDSLGHQAGDQCLIDLGVILKNVSNRPRDLAARYGGEEFVIILPDTDLAGAAVIAKKLQAAIEEAGIPHPDSDVSPVMTVSQGVCEWQDGADADSLTSAADKLLYEAKQGGRNTFKLGKVEVLLPQEGAAI